ncbi:hypothetical protein GCM10011583_74240 [Streptomyces camponoticapitis]|uniref:Uncharacterized protein n=2 Tax=Streptomyces camponoticapitis TaxID=1616125 RepID=A0ABQ2EYT2_9ACTN|nr:hypothetical protein GCM10011583_74240 [Streptomyces camponoticapitis]
MLPLSRCDYPHLCDACKCQAVTADEHAREQQSTAAAAAEEARDLEGFHRKADEKAEAERKARRFPFPVRPRILGMSSPAGRKALITIVARLDRQIDGETVIGVADHGHSCRHPFSSPTQQPQR